jgi:hypothetical protein
MDEFHGGENEYEHDQEEVKPPCWWTSSTGGWQLEQKEDNSYYPASTDNKLVLPVADRTVIISAFPEAAWKARRDDRGLVPELEVENVVQTGQIGAYGAGGIVVQGTGRSCTRVAGGMPNDGFKEKQRPPC